MYCKEDPIGSLLQNNPLHMRNCTEEHITCHEVEKDKCLEDVLYLTCPVFVGIPQQEPEAINKKLDWALLESSMLSMLEALTWRRTKEPSKSKAPYERPEST